MKRVLILAAALLGLANNAEAGGTHAGGHHDEMEMPVGKAGKASKVNRTIDVVMKETDDGQMIFEPGEIAVSRGETIRFAIVNGGETDHEFVLDDHDGMMKHKALMEKFPEMEHDDPNSVRLAPGEKGEVIWQFANSGEFQFGCLIPGHYEAGMRGPIVVK